MNHNGKVEYYDPYSYEWFDCGSNNADDFSLAFHITNSTFRHRIDGVEIQ